MNFFIKLFLFSQCILEVIANNEGTFKANDNIESYGIRVKKSILNNMKRKWTFPIHYRIRGDVNKKTVETALEIIQRETCITFKETVNFTKGGLYYVNGSSICASYVGKVSNDKPQDIILGKICNKVTTAIHETCHALGLIHEMTRHDRDSYVNVKYANIQPRVAVNFDSFNLTMASSYGLKYDFGSVMHYDRFAASKNGQFTMEPRNEIYLKTIGQSTRFGFNDAKQLNIHYCSDRCPEPKLKCKMNGYPNPNDCTVCKCPEFYTGTLCTKLKPSDKECGRRRFLKTRRTDQNLIVNGVKTCYIQITAPKGRKVRLYIEKTDLLYSFVCNPGHGLEVKFLNDKSVSGAMICGKNYGKIIISENNVVAMKYIGLTQNSEIKIRYSDVAK
uniref:Zinc metalloproteinase n=1 Tax=Strongyloides papillosus TaxID=174720 RepID=A0A0N5BN25_STREA